jgi:hypothetical protein
VWEYSKGQICSFNIVVAARRIYTALVVTWVSLSFQFLLSKFSLSLPRILIVISFLGESLVLLKSELDINCFVFGSDVRNFTSFIVSDSL